MAIQPTKPLNRTQATQSASESRDRLVKDMIEKDRAAVDAKTARLKALRLEREAAEPPPPPAPAKRARKPSA
jgi:hypothetical protein